MKNEARLGDLVGDIVVQVHRLMTENETGEYLDLRLRKLRAVTNSMLECVEAIAASRHK